MEKYKVKIEGETHYFSAVSDARKFMKDILEAGVFKLTSIIVEEEKKPKKK